MTDRDHVFWLAEAARSRADGDWDSMRTALDHAAIGAIAPVFFAPDAEPVACVQNCNYSYGEDAAAELRGTVHVRTE